MKCFLPMVNCILARIVDDPIAGASIYVLGWRKLIFENIILKGLSFPKFMRDLKGKPKRT